MRTAASSVRQRRDLTFKHNRELGRHGWLRLTPAYSVKLVEQILDVEQCEQAVFDPFSGTATTPLAAGNRGWKAFSTDINPFLVWLGRAKTAQYSATQLRGARRAHGRVVELLREHERDGVKAPPLHNIERWWTREQIRFLQQLRSAILSATRSGAARDLLTVAFCRTVIALSNAAFNHQSMSFKAPRRADNAGTPTARLRGEQQFTADATAVIESAGTNPSEPAHVLHDDARTLSSVVKGSFDLLVTSPPYPNRMSYIRELRPYMYWTGYLEEAREAGELDWAAIGGTWGIATSRLADWRPPCRAELSPELKATVAAIRKSGTPNAGLLAAYVAKYFFDVGQHLLAAMRRIGTRGRVHYIVGNSSFYGVLVPTERLYAQMLAALGFSEVTVRVLRKRNSKKELFEFDVCATAP